MTLFRAIPEAAGCSDVQLRKFKDILDALLDTNRTTNLTAVTDPEAAVKVHFADSLALMNVLNSEREQRMRIADIGAGAGFPTFPCAVITPGCDWYPIESVGKKVKFMEATARKAELPNVHPLKMRAEDLGRKLPTADDPIGRESFGMVTARALAAVPILLEIGLPLVAVGGCLTMFKTLRAADEIKAIDAFAPLLGGIQEAPYRYHLPGDENERLILRVRKIAPTPEKFPRKNGLPFKKPFPLLTNKS